MNAIHQRVQDSNATEFNRYPAIFSKVAAIAPPKGRVLSFGCSTGEEVASLDSLYLEACTLIGADVSLSALAKARSLALGGRNDVHFIESAQLAREAPFDIVMALSVLCRWPDAQGQEDLSEIYSFRLFSEHVARLAEHVVPGGVLVLHNTNYYFEDTLTFAECFEVHEPEFRNIGFVTRFDTEGRRYANARPGHVFFRRRC